MQLNFLIQSQYRYTGKQRHTLDVSGPYRILVHTVCHGLPLEHAHTFRLCGLPDVEQPPLDWVRQGPPQGQGADTIRERINGITVYSFEFAQSYFRPKEMQY